MRTFDSLEEAKMVTATVEELGSAFPAFLDRATSGEQVLILRDGVVVARLTAEPTPGELPKGVPILGRGNGKVLYMAPDFDTPMEEFAEYME